MSSSEIAKPLLEIGTRISCYWCDDDEWYEGTVADHLGGEWFWIRYDNEDEGEMNLKEDKWRISLHPKKSIQTKDMMTRSSLNVTVELDAKKRKEDEFVDLDRPLKRRGRHPIEQVDLESGEIIERFPSLRQAEEATGISRFKIKRVLKRHDGNANAGGYFWRCEGEIHGPLPDPYSVERRGIANSVPIEQVDLDSGEKIAAFPSMRQAEESTGINRQVISRVLERRGKANGGGYFWRYQGETHGPWPAKIDQLCLKTGRVISSFDTIRDAAKAVGICTTGISYCCNGVKGHKTAGGFGWRFSMENNNDGSTVRVLPKKKKRRRIVDQLCLETGRVIATFDSIRDAAKAVGTTTTGISKVCNGRQNSKSARGFGWRFSKGDDD